MNNNTIISIITKSIHLEGVIKMGLGPLNNIAITGNGTTIMMCNNSGSMYCEYCNNVIIEGITWDRCGNPNETKAAGITFNITSNISIYNCTFQHSQVWAVALVGVSEVVNINKSNFMSNSRTVACEISCSCGGLHITVESYKYVRLIISDSFFFENGQLCTDTFGTAGGLDFYSPNSLSFSSITFKQVEFISNRGAMFFYYTSASQQTDQQIIHLDNIIVCNNTVSSSFCVCGFYGTATTSNVIISSSVFMNNSGTVLWWKLYSDETTILISNSSFDYNKPALQSTKGTVTFAVTSKVVIAIVDVNIFNSVTPDYPDGYGTIDVNTINSDYLYLNMTRVNMYSKKYLGDSGGTVYIQANENNNATLLFDHCKFIGSSSAGRGAALYIDTNQNQGDKNNFLIFASIIDCEFSSTMSYDSVVYFSSTNLTICSTSFTDNTGSSMYLSACDLTFCGTVQFTNNTADNGAALFLEQQSTVSIEKGTTVSFINNSATEYGGAIYVDLVYNCPGTTFDSSVKNCTILFANNVAVISGNSIYFSVPKLCKVNTDINDPDSIMYVPCQFNYSQSIDGTKHIHYNCTTLSYAEFPLVTSPNKLRLHVPCNNNESSNISDCDVYLMKDNILGLPMTFHGAVFDYFGKPAGSTQYYVRCTNCSSVKLTKTHILIDNVTPLSLTFVGEKMAKGLNFSVELISTSFAFKKN